MCFCVSTERPARKELDIVACCLFCVLLVVFDLLINYLVRIYVRVCVCVFACMCAGAAGFFLNFAALWCVGATSATTYAVVNTVNNVSTGSTFSRERERERDNDIIILPSVIQYPMYDTQCMHHPTCM